MRNWKPIGFAFAAVLATAAVAVAYSPTRGSVVKSSSPALAMSARLANVTYTAAHKDVMHTRVAQSCIAVGQACVLNGTPCCGTATCKGTFPNTTCQ